MINTKEQGIIISINKIREHDLIIKVLSEKDIIISGVVYGGNSSKKKLVYQIGYFIEFSLSIKNSNTLPSFNSDLIKPYILPIINDKYKSFAILNIISILKISILEGQKINGLYFITKEIINKINIEKNWISYLCEWMYKLLKLIGYQIDYKNNQHNKYFDLHEQEFTNLVSTHSVEFPHSLLNHKKRVFIDEIESFFIIFESIYRKNHLDNINYKMPINYIKFKNSIIERLNNNVRKH